MTNFSVQITADTVAWYGAIMATAGIVLSSLNYLRDRSRVRVKLTNGLLTSGGSVLDDVQLILTAINIGRRKITLDGAGFLLENGYNVFFTESIGVRFPCELEEGKSVSMFVNKDELLLDVANRNTKIKHMWFRDATGKCYKTRESVKKLTKN